MGPGAGNYVFTLRVGALVAVGCALIAWSAWGPWAFLVAVVGSFAYGVAVAAYVYGRGEG